MGHDKSSAAEISVSLAPQWDKWVSAAYLRLFGHTQKDAAATVGVSERTLRVWEADARWVEANAQAAARWAPGVAALAKSALVRALKSDPADGHLALKIVERTDPTLAPPVQRVSILNAPTAERFLSIVGDRITANLNETTAERVIAEIRARCAEEGI